MRMYYHIRVYGGIIMQIMEDYHDERFHDVFHDLL